jgi:hypothetical protein
MTRACWVSFTGKENVRSNDARGAKVVGGAMELERAELEVRWGVESHLESRA